MLVAAVLAAAVLATASPSGSSQRTWIVVLAGVLLFGGVASLARRRQTIQKDPQRAFSAAQRAAGFARCQNRCEHISLLGRRCKAQAVHGDHIWPHSRGGATTLANFAGLCARHNLVKGARTPSRMAIRRLERRRRAYFPPGQPVEVVWRIGDRNLAPPGRRMV